MIQVDRSVESKDPGRKIAPDKERFQKNRMGKSCQEGMGLLELRHRRSNTQRRT